MNIKHWDIQDFEEYFRTRYGYVIPTSLVIREILKFTHNETILEIGAGTGLWAHILRNKGQKITPTDLKPKVYKDTPRELIDKYAWFNSFIDVEKLSGIDSVKKYNKHEVLMIVWPEQSKIWAYETLQLFKGNKFIYVGNKDETGDINLLNTLSKDWVEQKSIKLPNLLNQHNPILYLYKKNKK